MRQSVRACQKPKTGNNITSNAAQGATSKNPLKDDPMSLIVQKFGGSSVADTQKILAAARKAIRAAQAGNQVVVVVSAMGKTTDHLISLASEITDRPSSREMDMLMSSGEQVTIALLAIALESLGYKAISMTGAQIGIKTDGSHTRARIKSISTDSMKRALSAGKIVIAAGFQGIDDENDITTLGRGGSDTSAVALAAALGADECEIYTDVDGVYTTDPRILPEARKLKRISYDEMLELASLGAGVMHSRSIEFGKKFGVAIHVRSSFSDTVGTTIAAEPESADPVTGVAFAKNEALVTIVGVPDQPGNAMRIFAAIAQNKIPTDMIVQNIGIGGKTDLSFTVPATDLLAVTDLLTGVVKEIGAQRVESQSDVAKISIVGLRMEMQHGVADKMFRALADKKINICMISTSEIKVSTLLTQADATRALRIVHNTFELHLPPKTAPLPLNRESKYHAESKSLASAQLDFSHLSGMEAIVIEAVELDRTQSRVSLPDIPGKPGIAAQVFERIAAADILVNLIVQSYSRNDKAMISFTVPRQKLQKTLEVATALSEEWKTPPPVHQPKVAILTVRGTGLRSNTAHAYRMFKVLSDAGINVNIISTSERNISITIDDAICENGLELLKTEFAKEMI